MCIKEQVLTDLNNEDVVFCQFYNLETHQECLMSVDCGNIIVEFGSFGEELEAEDTKLDAKDLGSIDEIFENHPELSTMAYRTLTDEDMFETEEDERNTYLSTWCEYEDGFTYYMDSTGKVIDCMETRQ